MLNKNSLIAGLLAGVVFPVMAWAAAFLLKYNELIINKPGLPYFVAIGLNLLVLRYCLKKGAGKTGTGVIIITLAFMLMVFVLKIQPVR